MRRPEYLLRPSALLGVLTVGGFVLLGGCSSSPTSSRESLRQEFHFLFSGTVVSSESGDPIPGARVELYHQRLRGNCGFKGGSGCYTVYHVFETVFADEEGRYELDATVTETSCLWFGLRGRAFGFEEIHRSVPIPCNGGPAEIQLSMKPLPPPSQPQGTSQGANQSANR